VRATSGSSLPSRKERSGFTLLEVIIALVLVAILVSAAVPYLFDAFTEAAGERSSKMLAERVAATRSLAMESGLSQRIILTPDGFDGCPLPKGWILLIRSLNDDKFHPPERGRTWEFTKAGVCEPLAVRIAEEARGGRFIETTFDPLTALPLNEDR
jgi:prepilin-type N-terminal cleavage/methylation domain-containing protein